MGFAELLFGKQHPVSQFVGENRNALRGAFAGFGRGTDIGSGLGYAAQGAAALAPLDDAFAQAEAEKAERAQEINKTVEWLQQQHPDLAQMVEAGMPVPEAWQTALERMKPKAPSPMDIRSVGSDLLGVDPITGKVRTLYDGPEAQGAMPTSYQEFLLSQQNPEYAAQLNSSSSRPPTEGQRRNIQLSTVTAPELQAVEENWDELTNPANQAIGANTPLGAPGFALTSPGYQQATSALKTIAQSYLYSVSGAAATDAETQKIVDAVTPKFGESKASADAKKARIKTMVESIKAAGGAPAIEAGGNYVYNPATGKLEPQ
jgi:hypothetical protein